MTDYSQNQEQQVILDYFKEEIGTFISIGENNGIHLSNVRALAINGWSGVVVEPSVDAFKQLSQLYPSDGVVQCLNFAVSDFNGEVDFFESGEHLKIGDHALLSTIIPSEMDRWKNTETFTKKTTKVVDVKTLMHHCTYKKFDMLSCDAEGCDFIIIQQFDFAETGIRLVCCETNSKNVKMYDDLMIPQGFHVFFNNYENRIYVK